VLWLGDLVRRGGRWIVNLDQVHDTGLVQSLHAARRESDDGPAYSALLRALAQAYRILLTRGVYGTSVWFEDEETRQHVLRCLGD
jgi:DUF2075 family protein